MGAEFAGPRTVLLGGSLIAAAGSVIAFLRLLGNIGRISAQINRIADAAEKLSGGDFGTQDIAPGCTAEINRAAETFNRMKNMIRGYIEEIRAQDTVKEDYLREKMRNMNMENLLRHMRIYTLQAQMNPHFLFNSLNTGMQLAIVEGADRTCEFMESMAKFFRHATGNKEIIVPLRYEIEGINYYFDILRVRFYRNIDLVLNYDESLLDAVRIPVSLIQPLVENCIVHAFKARTALLAALPEGLEVMRPLIRVQVERQENRLVISVRDNGCGMSGEIIQELLRPLSAEELSLSRAMGLASIIQRLYFFYPDDPGIISIESGEGTGTNILVRIDMEREPCIVSL